MTGRCEDCNNLYGDKCMVYDMRRDIDDLKKSKFWKAILIATFLVFFSLCVIFVILYRNLLTQPVILKSMPAGELRNLTELFDNQLANILTIIGVLMTIFGFVLPMLNIFLQRQTLKEERESIQREIDISLSIIRDQEKDFRRDLTVAKEERNKKISEIEKKIDSGMREITKKQQDFLSESSAMKVEMQKAADAHKEVEESINRHEKLLDSQNRETIYTYGYFMQQLEMADSDPTGSLIYSKNALDYFIQYPDYKDSPKRIMVCMNVIKSTLDSPLPEIEPEFLDELNEVIANIKKTLKDDIEMQSLAKNILAGITKAKRTIKKQQQEKSQLNAISEK